MLALSACAGGDGGTKVLGELVVSVDGARTGFVFDSPIRLPAPRTVAPQPGLTTGECVLNDEGARILLRRQPLDDADAGLRSFELDLPAEGDSYAVAVVADTEHAAGEAASCALRRSYADLRSGALGVQVDCALAGAAQATGALHFTGCRFE